MKLFVLAAVLCSTFAIAFGAAKRPIEQETTYTEERKYCNSLYPGEEDPVQKMLEMVVNREPLGPVRNFGNTEWCHLHCILEKAGYYAPDGSMDIRYIMEYILGIHPELSSSSPLIYHTLLQIDASTKDMSDKCSKTFVSYYRTAEALFLGTISSELQAKPHVKAKVVEALLGGNELPQEYDAITEKSIRTIETFFHKNSKKRCL